jgi:hypothetical protein
MQSGLLALSIKDPSAYIIQLVYALPSSLDIRRFTDVWETIAIQNPILQTRFFKGDSTLLQVVVKEPLRWHIVRDETFKSLLLKEKSRKMSLSKPISWHTLLHNSNSKGKEYHLVWTIHHSLVNGWSASKTASLVEQEYFRHPTLPYTRGFNRFIHHLSNQNMDAQKEYWSS